MAKWKIHNVKISGVSACVPSQKFTTKELGIMTETEAETFDRTVGIKERRIAPTEVCASDLCQKAAETLISELGWERESIDILIFESVTGDYRTPPTSCLLQQRLGLPSTTFCLDMPMGCCGFLYALNVGANMLTTGSVKRGLLLIGDTAMRMGSTKDKSRVPLFGDGGTAVAIEYDPDAPEMTIEFHTDGSGSNALMTPHGGFRNPVSPESFIEQDFGNGIVRAPIHTLINGMDVFAFAITKPPKSAESFMVEEGIDKDKDVDYFLIHQANKMIVDRVVKKLKLPTEKVPYNLEEFGNLGGAAIPTLMVTRLREQLTSGRQRLLMSSFGLGLTWATMSGEMGPAVIPELQYL